jgi:hypothetical protein
MKKLDVVCWICNKSDHRARECPLQTGEKKNSAVNSPSAEAEVFGGCV